ncbi:protein CC2D2B-like [Brachyhypopomus gauderio]|uniref:protein CC2D2B-like n=1 Tax=Brachyhypopomus gauderio TaxID=698409 RepID=UPI0040427B33
MTSWPLLRYCDIGRIKGLEFDSNHPDNLVLSELLEGERRLRAGAHIRLSDIEEEDQFATDEQLGVSKRFGLLRLRSAQDTDDITHPGPIPLLQQEIPDDMLEEYGTIPTPFLLEEDYISAQRV